MLIHIKKSHFQSELGVQIKQKIIMDNKQEKVYALNANCYYRTNRASNHPSIILANQRNVHLSFITCNQILRGQSHFRNPEAENFYRECRSLPSKSQMYKSQITDATSNVHEDHIRNSHDLKINIKPYRRETRLISTSFHSGNSQLKIENPHGLYTSRIETGRPIYQYEQTNKLEIPKTLEQLRKFKPDTLIKEVNRNQGTNNSKSDMKLIKTLQEGAKLENSYHLSELSKSNATVTNNQNLKSTPIINQNQAQSQKNEAEQKLKHQKERQAAALQQKIQNQRLHSSSVNSSSQMPQFQIQKPQKTLPIKLHQNTFTPQHQTVYSTSTQQIYTPSKTPIVYQSTYKQLSSSPTQIDKNLTPSTVNSYYAKYNSQELLSTPRQENYVSDSPRSPQHLNPELQQLNRLRQELAKRDKQLTQYKKSLQQSQKINKTLQQQLKKLQAPNTQVYPNPYPENRSAITSSLAQSYNSSHQLSKQLGSSMSALLYFTLFIVLLSKEMNGK